MSTTKPTTISVKKFHHDSVSRLTVYLSLKIGSILFGFFHSLFDFLLEWTYSKNESNPIKHLRLKNMNHDFSFDYLEDEDSITAWKLVKEASS